MRPKLTKKEQEIFDIIIPFKMQNDGRSPTIREVQELVGISSSSVASYQIEGLVEKGYLMRGDEGSSQSRSLMVVGGEWRYLGLPGEDGAITVSLLGERPQTWNKLKRMDKRSWHKHVITAKWLVLAELRQMYDGGQPDMFECRVDIDVVVYFDRRPFDSSNIPLKLYEDGLVGILIKDDSPKYVRRVSTESRIDRARPRIEITVRPVRE